MRSNDANHAATRRPFADSLAVPLGVGAPAAARRFIADHVATAAPAVLDDALLLVSELVTNSVRHSRADEDEDVVVRVRVLPGECWLEVEDPGRGGVIAPQPGDVGAGSGFGLQLVELLSDQWGVVRAPDGPTRVWLSLATAGATAATSQLDHLLDAIDRSPRDRPARRIARAVVERVSAFVSPDPNVDAALAEARTRASRGDDAWAEWLEDLRAGRAIVALLEIEVTLSVAGATQRLRTRTPAVWLELEPHPPLLERQVQEVATVSLSTLSSAIGMPLGVHLPTADLAAMSVHVELDRAIRERLPAPAAATLTWP